MLADDASLAPTLGDGLLYSKAVGTFRVALINANKQNRGKKSIHVLQLALGGSSRTRKSYCSLCVMHGQQEGLIRCDSSLALRYYGQERRKTQVSGAIMKEMHGAA
jgi:hypothetical protein